MGFLNIFDIADPKASMEGLRKKCLAGFTEALQIGGESATFQGWKMPFDAVF